MLFISQGGGIKLNGCAKVHVRRNYTIKFPAGSLVYFVAKAKRGFFENHTIKEPIMKGNLLAPFYLYKDTYNALFNEDELCTYDEAVQYALEWREAVVNYSKSHPC